MGKLILCSSAIAKQPYCFPMTKTKVYSIEEVCYYIRNNIYMMQEEVFDKAFADWIRNELGMAGTADKLDRMREDHNNLKDIVVTLCCSCDYYTEREINDLIAIMDQTQNVPLRGRQKIKADTYLKNGSLERAKQEYERILKSPDMINASSEEYGDLYYRLGAALAGMGEYRHGFQAFQKSYEYAKTQKALESCLYCLKLGGMPEEYEKAAIEMGVTREQQTFMDARYEEALRQSVDSRECKMVRRIRRMKEQGDPSYEKVAKELIFQWKTEYRKSMLP